MGDFSFDIDWQDLGNQAAGFVTNPFAGLQSQFHQVKETVGELTGSNAIRKSLYEQRDAIRQSQLEQERVFREEQNRRFMQDAAASRAAGAAQRRSMYSGGNAFDFNSADLYLGGR